MAHYTVKSSCRKVEGRSKIVEKVGGKLKQRDAKERNPKEGQKQDNAAVKDGEPDENTGDEVSVTISLSVTQILYD